MEPRTRKTVGYNSIPWLGSVGVVLCGLVLTAWALREEREQVAVSVENAFAPAANAIRANIEHRLNTYQGAMRGVQGFFLASENINRDDFRNYVDSLRIPELLPGVQALAFVVPLDASLLPAHLAEQQADFGSVYQLSPPGERERYALIAFIEPLEDNLAALGFDVLTNLQARDAMEMALSRNDISITARITLVQDTGREGIYSFVMYLPIFQPGAALDTLAARERALIGWVDAPFRMNDFMSGLAGEFNPDIYIEIHDGEPGPDTRMYHSPHASGQQAVDPAHPMQRHVLPIGGREWTVLLNSTPAFEAPVTDRHRLWLIGFSGVTLSLLLALLVWLMMRARYSAEFRFRRLFTQAGDGIVVFDDALRMQDVNPAVLRMLGRNREELLACQLRDLVAPEHHEELARKPASLSVGRTWFVEWQLRDRQGYSFPAQLSISRLDGRNFVGIVHDMTQHMKAQQRIQRLTQLYHALSATNHEILRRGDPESLFEAVCRIAVEHGGLAMAWVGQVRGEDGRVVPLASAGRGLAYLDSLNVSADAALPEGRGPIGKALRDNQPVVVNDFLSDPLTRLRQAQARQYGWHAMATFPVQRDGRPYVMFSVYHSHTDAFDREAIALIEEMVSDIGFALDNHDREQQRQQASRALAESEAKLSVILDNVGACIYMKDCEGRYLYANQQVLDLWGVNREDVIGNTDDLFFDAETVVKIRENDARVLEIGEVLQREEVNRVVSTGTTATYWSVKLPLRRDDGVIYALCGISTDISERKATDARIEFLSNYDPLTQLPNRLLLRDRAEQALATAARTEGPVALLCIDLDRFKIVNESLGPSVGDEVLNEFAQRLGEQLRPEQTLCRQGGDDFVLLLPDSDADEAAHIARRILDSCVRPFLVHGQQLVLTSCIGIALYPEDARDFEHLARSADAALFRAKRSGPGSFEFFTPELHAQAIEALEMESELRQALGLGQLLLHYQPQYDLQEGTLVGMEALVRWQHPHKGLIPPGRFIAIAEESGLIVDLGNWVLREAISQNRAWQLAGLPVVPVAVNLSARQFRQPELPLLIAGMLGAAGLDPGLLELEITEGVAMDDSAYTEEVLAKMKALGISLAIDDFGMGYSSLSYLKRYPIDTLKIDQSFVQGLGGTSGDEAIIDAIIALAHSLGFQTLAEGVETRRQLDYLREHHCDHVQGYLLGRPVPAEDFTVLLREERRMPGGA